MVSRITPKLRVGGLFLALLLAAPVAGAAQAEPLMLTASRTELTGAFSMHGPAPAIWLRPDGAAEAGLRLTAFELMAPVLHVTNLTYAGGARTSVDGQPVSENEPRAVTETSRHARASVDVLAVHAHAELRILPAAGQQTRLDVDGAHTLFADAAHAPEWSASTTIHTDTENLARFFQVPQEVALLTGVGGAVAANGGLTIWARGIDLRVTSDGRTTDFLTRTSTAQAPAGVGPVEAETSTWTDFVLDVAGDGTLDASWQGQIDLFAPHANILGHGTARFIQANGTIPDLDGVLEVHDRDHEHTGALEAAVGRTIHDGVGRVAWTFPAPPAATPAAVTSDAGMPAWALILSILLLGAALGGGLPLVVWNHRRRRARPEAPTSHMEPQPPAGGPTARATRPVAAGRHEDPLPMLRRAVRARPKDPEARYALGVALGLAGRIREAVRHLEYAVRREPAALGLLVSETATEPFRHDPLVAQLVRRAARRFREEDAAGYV